MTSEESVIASLLVNESGKLSPLSVPFLKPEHFANRLLGEMYGIFLKSAEAGEVENVSTISEKLKDIEGLPESDIIRIIGELMAAHITVVGFERCCKNVYTEYRRRKATALINDTHFSFGDFDNEISALITELTELQGIEQEEAGMSVSDMANLYRDVYPKDAAELGIQTGIGELDKLLGGTNGGDLCFIGARPSAGKSAFANQLSRHFETLGKRVGFFNLEMQRDSVYERLLASQSKVSLSRIRGQINPSNWELDKLDRANVSLQKIKNLIFYTGTFTAEKVRHIVERDKLEVVIIDYMQLLRSSGRYANRTSEVGEISHAIKAIAMDFNIPIFPLVQLNRAVEMRDDKEPTLSDIRESGDIEQDASQVIFLWTVPNPKDKDDTSIKGCRVAKNRNGQLGSFKMVFRGETMRFEELPEGGEAVAKSPKETKSYGFFEPLDEDQIELPWNP